MHKKRVRNTYYFYTTKRSKDGKRTKSIYLGKDYKLAKLKEKKLNPKKFKKRIVIPQQILIILLIIFSLFSIYLIFTFPTHTGYATYEEISSKLPALKSMYPDFSFSINNTNLIISKDNAKIILNDVNINNLLTELKTQVDLNFKNNKIRIKTPSTNIMAYATLYIPKEDQEGIFYSNKKVYSCSDSDISDFLTLNCTKWQLENINVSENDDYYFFNVTHFTTYTIGTGQNCVNLQQCLFFINGTADNCQISVNDYQETFGDKFWISNISFYNFTGMVVGYDFEQGSGTPIIDRSGNGRDGDASLGGSYSIQNIVKYSYYMDGNNDYINVTYNDDFNTTGGFSMATYFNTTLIGNQGNKLIIDVGGAVNGRRMYYASATSNFTCRFKNQAGTAVICGQIGTTSRDKVHHGACVYDETNILVYLDGVLSNSCALASPLIGMPDKNIIMGAITTGAGDWNGTLDNSVIYNRTLTALEVQQIAYGYSSKYTSILTDDIGFIDIFDKGNISIDFNGSSFIGNSGSSNGMKIRTLTGLTENITISNSYFDSFNTNFYASGKNITLINITSVNSNGNGIVLGNQQSNNITLIDSKSIYSASNGIYIDGLGINTYILNVNSSNNVGDNLEIHGDTQNADIRNSFFYNSTNNNGILSYAEGVIFINNTIKDNLVDEKSGFLITTGNNLWLENSTFYNNNINLYISMSKNETIRNNIFNVSYDSNVGGLGSGANIWLDGVNYSRIINNTIKSSKGVGIALTDAINSYDNVGNNFTGNIFKNTTTSTYTYDIWLISLNSKLVDSNSIWLNHFYTTTPAETSSTMTSYCVNNEGNFYNESINRFTINETDCGLMNITAPDIEVTLTYIPYTINWTRQSGVKTINYSIYFSNNSGTKYFYINSTTGLSYTWNFTGAANLSEYVIKIIPNDGLYNGTNDNSTQKFSIQNFKPYIPELISPTNETSTTTRNLAFSWTESIDPNGDLVYYDILIDNNPEFTSPDRSDNQTGTTYTPATPIPLDEDHYWKVRATDKLNGGLTDFTPMNIFTIDSVISIIINGTRSINFGTKLPGNTDDTTDDSPLPILIQNDGNSFLNMTVVASRSLWATQGLNTQYFKYKAGVNESGSYGNSQSSFTNMLSTAALFVDLLNYANATDTARLESSIEVPPDETPGDKNTDITFTATLGDHS